MCEIPEDIVEEVNKVAEMLVSYKNEKKLNWCKAYDDVLVKAGLNDRLKDTRFETYVVKKITYLGYDIIGDPFGLEKFR